MKALIQFCERSPLHRAFVIFCGLALVVYAFFGCSGTQTPGTVSHEARTISQSIAAGYCTVHRIATPLILFAETRYPAMTIPKEIADAFCTVVDQQKLALREAESHVLLSGETPMLAPTYSLDPSGFSLRSP